MAKRSKAMLQGDLSLPRTHLKILPRSEPNSLRLAFGAFLLDREAARRSRLTIRTYDSCLRDFIAFLEGQGVTTPEAIAPSHIRAYLVSLQRQGLKDTTTQNRARVANIFCHFLVEEGIIPESPMRKVKMPRVDRRVLPAFSPEDVKRLLAACDNPRDTAIVLCLLDTGLRAGEFAALNVADVDLKTGAVQVRRGKGGKGRVVFLGAKARKALLKYVMARGNTKPDEPLWLSGRTGGRLTAHGLASVLRDLGKRANVARCHPHTFRRTFALWSLRAGMNVYALQQIMGHSDLTILRRYLALVEQDLQEAHRKHGAVDNML
jgi:site-specific recombinase XerD